MNTPRFRKMVDIDIASKDLHHAVREYLHRHGIHGKTFVFKRTGYVRYFVHEADLCCARCMIPYLKSIATNGNEVRD